jgi:hypothetical protein
MRKLASAGDVEPCETPSACPGASCGTVLAGTSPTTARCVSAADLVGPPGGPSHPRSAARASGR